MATPDIISYTCKTSPFALRVELAFQEVKADVTRYWIDLSKKPEWYASRVNPTGQVPAIVYGSPNSDPEHPSAESAKLTESLVLLEFVADLYPDSGLLPKDPVERARVRSFIDALSTKVLPPAGALFAGGGDSDAFVTALAAFQDLLPPTAQFAVGDHFTIADAAFAPFLSCWELFLRHDVGRFAEGTGLLVYDELFRSERFARLQEYFANISSRESFRNCFDSERLLAKARIMADATERI